jgi:hypothetical protein
MMSPVLEKIRGKRALPGKVSVVGLGPATCAGDRGPEQHGRSEVCPLSSVLLLTRSVPCEQRERESKRPDEWTYQKRTEGVYVA